MIKAENSPKNPKNPLNFPKKSENFVDFSELSALIIISNLI